MDGDGGRAWNKGHKQESHPQALQSTEYTKRCSVLFPFLFRQTGQLSNILTNKVIIVLIIAMIIMALVALDIIDVLSSRG